MADDEDEGARDAPFDPTFANAGPRRSTFTPPPADVHDDDALADALAQEYTRLGSGTINLPPEQPPTAAVEDEHDPEDEYGTDAPPAPVPAAAEEPEPAAVGWDSAPPAPPAPSTDDQPPPWVSAPAPDPSQAVPLDSPFDPPVRRSLSDEEIAHWVDDAAAQPGGTLDVIEQLQTQLRLREEEAREFQAWESRMHSLGTPEAAAVVDEVRSTFTDVIPIVPAPPAPPTSPQDLDAAAPVAPPRTEPPPEAPLPAWDVPPPGDDWAPDGFEREAAPDGVAPAQQDLDELFGQAPEPERPIYSLDEPSDEPAPFAFGADQPVVPPIAPELTGEPEPQPVAAPLTPFESLFAPPAPETIASDVPPPDTGDVVEAILEPDGADVEVAEPDATSAPEVVEPEVVEPGVVEPEEPPALVEPPPFAAAPFEFPPAPVGPAAEHPPGDEGSAEEPGAGTSGTIFIEPLPLAVGEAIPTDTGSVMIIDTAYDRDLDDDIDETDRVVPTLTGPVAVDAAGTASVPEQIAPPSGPISSVRVPADEVVLVDNEPTPLPVFSIENSGPEPTLVDHRVGRAARLFWLWFAANSSILSVGLGAAVFAVGMSLRQSIVAILAGVALSFIPLGLTTLAGKRSGQPTMIVSRASFGVLGNVVPAALAFITRAFWGAVLLWLLASAIAIVLVGAELSGALGDRAILLVSLGLAFALSTAVAFAGYPLLARIQLVLSAISGVLVVGLVAMTAGYVDIPAALTTPDGPWVLTLSGAVLVFSFVGLVWANSGADLARYQRPGTSGASSMLWSTFGATLPAFLLIGYGALLAASNRGIASGFVQSPLDTLALMLPSWYPVPLIAAAALSLLSGVTVSVYSSGFALQAMGVRVKRQYGVLIGAAALGLLALLFTFAVPGGIFELFTDAATTLAVPVAAWAGIFAAETMIRNRRFESESLLRRGGVYEDVRWVNLAALLVITVLGWGLTTASITWLSWQGYGFALLGLPLDGDVARTDLGVLVALVLGLLTPIASGIPAIRRQEATKL